MRQRKASYDCFTIIDDDMRIIRKYNDVKG